uniref:Uncharacterized protein n=1 Tax=Heterosigma akashiwo TaxID=2829 RepID=A0A7S3XLK4_HETAK
MVMTQPETFSNENEKEMKCEGSLDTTSDKLQQENNSDEEKDGSSYECSEREEDGEDLGVGPDDLVGLAAFLLVVACPAPLHQHSLISETVQLLTHSMKYSNTAPLDDARFLEEWIQMQVIVFHVNLVFHTVGLAEHCVPPTSFSTRLALSLFRYINSSDQKELMCYCPDLVLNPSSSLSRALIQGDGIKVTTDEVSEDSNNNTCEKGEERKDVEETGTVPLLLDHAVQFDQSDPHKRKVDAVEACTNDNNHCELWDMNQWRATVASLVVHVG